MPVHLYYLCLLVVILSAGCQQKEPDSLDLDPSKEPAAQVTFGVDIRQLSSESRIDPSNGITPLENDAERRSALADITEKVYRLWNAALTDYRKDQDRWPSSLKELQQYQGDQELPPPPPGFILHLDKEAGEIYLSRVKK